MICVNVSYSTKFSVSKCFYTSLQGPIGFPGDPGPPGEAGPNVSARKCRLLLVIITAVRASDVFIL